MKKISVNSSESSIGLDCVCIQIDAGRSHEPLLDTITLNNRNNKRYLVISNAKKPGIFNVAIVCPTILRGDNRNPLSLLDSIKFDLILDTLKSDLRRYLGLDDDSLLVVKKVEINSTITVKKSIPIDSILELLSFASLRENDAETIAQQVRGVPVRKGRVVKRKVINSVKTKPSIKSNRFSAKYYDKSRELGIKDRQIFRLELCYNARGVKTTLRKKTVTLRDLLTPQTLQMFINTYADDVAQYIFRPLSDYLNDLTDLIVESLCKGQGLYKTFLLWREYIPDYAIFRKCVKRYYKKNGFTSDSANTEASRTKKKALNDGIVVNQGATYVLQCLSERIKEQKKN